MGPHYPPPFTAKIYKPKITPHTPLISYLALLRTIDTGNTEHTYTFDIILKIVETVL
jgi:hypothetical protein